MRHIIIALALVAVATVSFGQFERVESLDARQEKSRPEATAWYAMQQRASARRNADGTVPENALWRAKLQRDALLREQSDIALDSTSWTYFGPGNIGGRIRAVIIHPTNLNTIWVGSVGGGIWKTTNGGTSWFPLDDFMASLCVGCMAIDPTNPNVLYAGTGEGFFESAPGSNNKAAVKGAGIFRTTDGGTTWSQLGSTANPDFDQVTRIAINPSNPQHLLATTATGIFLSQNGGASFTQTYAGHAYDVDFSPTSNNIVVAGLHDAPFVVRSTDYGMNWTSTTGISDAHRAELMWSKSQPNNVYAAVSRESAARIRVYKSTNAGQTFSLVTTGNGISTYAAYNNTLWVDPTNDNNVIVGGVYIWRSTNQGATFTQAFTSVHPDFHVMVEVPNFDGTTNRRVYFGHDGGISTATNVYANTTTNLNNSLGITQFYSVAIANSTGRMIAGAQDNGTQLYTGNVNGWSDRIGGDGVICAQDPTDANIFYGGYYWMNMFRSTDGGTNFPTEITGGITDHDTTVCNFIPPLILDPNQSNTMLAGTVRLWRSTNVRTGNPPTWTVIKAAIVDGGDSREPRQNSELPRDHFNNENPLNISSIAVAPGNSNIIWVGHNNGQVWKTTNGTAASPSWTRMDTNGPLPGRWASRIVVDGSNNNRVYVSFMGWAQDSIWKTEDGGSTWTQITGTGQRKIPMAPVSSIALDPLKPGHLIAGTDIGIFTTWDDGQTWSVVTQGPGTVPIDELTWRNNTQLMAATYGRGIWQATVTATNTDKDPSSFNVFRGILQSGGLPDVLTSDDNRLVVKNGLVLNQSEAPVTIDFTTTAPQTIASQFVVTVEGSVTTGGLQQRVFAFNYDTSQWDQLDVRNATVSDQTVQLTVSSNVSSYINPTTRESKVRVTYKAGGPVGSQSWNGRIDTVHWVFSQ